MQTSTEVSVRFRSHLCIVAAMSLLLGVWGCWWGYPFRLHPDTHIVVEDAWRIATTGQTVVSGYMYGWLPRLLYAGAMAHLATVMPHEPPARDLYLDMEAPFWAYIVARTVNALLSTGLVVVVAMLGARLLGPQGGVLAALAVAVSFLRVRECHFASPDTPQTFFIWLSIYLTVRAFYGIGRLRDWAIAGCAAGAAAACRLPAGLVIVTPLFASLLAFSDRERKDARRTARLLTVLAGAAAAFAVANYGLLMDPIKIVMAMAGEGGKHEGPGIFPARLGALDYFTRQTPSGGVGALMVLASGLGLLAWLFGSRRQGLSIVLSFAIPFYTFIVLTGQPSRWFLPIVAFLSLCTGGLSLLHARGGKWRVLVWALLLPALSISVVQCVMADYWMSVPNTRALAAQWIDRNVPARAGVSSGPWWDTGPFDHVRVRQVPLPSHPYPTGRARAEFVTRAWASPMFQALLDVLGPTMRDRVEKRVEAARETLRVTYAPRKDFPLPLSWYRDHGVDYIVLSDVTIRRRLGQHSGTDDAKTRSWREFFRSVEHECEKVATFSPPPSIQICWPLAFAEHPEVTVYRIPHANDP